MYVPTWHRHSLPISPVMLRTAHHRHVCTNKTQAITYQSTSTLRTQLAHWRWMDLPALGLLLCTLHCNKLYLLQWLCCSPSAAAVLCCLTLSLSPSLFRAAKGCWSATAKCTSLGCASTLSFHLWVTLWLLSLDRIPWPLVFFLDKLEDDFAEAGCSASIGVLLLVWADGNRAGELLKALVAWFLCSSILSLTPLIAVIFAQHKLTKRCCFWPFQVHT